MQPNYAAQVAAIYDNCADRAQPLNEEWVVQAGIVVERMYPPADTGAVLSVLTALNLLNAAVKHTWGASLVSYNYIKGMAASLMVYLLEHPMEGVTTYYDGNEDVAYFTVWGIQVSFHHIPLYSRLTTLLVQYTQQPQQWEGRQLQLIAVELFRLTMPDDFTYTSDDEVFARYVMRHYRRPAQASQSVRRPLDSYQLVPYCVDLPKEEDKMASLDAALHFRLWDRGNCTLWHRRRHKLMPIIRYLGDNYMSFIDGLIGDEPRIPTRSQRKLVAGHLYYVSPQKRIASLTRYNFFQRLTQCHYEVVGDEYRNLCITYGIACYLGMLFPMLKFVCILNYNHLVEQRVYYSYHELVRVPVPSPARMLKVWMVVDTSHRLKDFAVDMLPQALIDDYLQTEDYYQDYEVLEDHDGRQGIIAFRQFMILEPLYRLVVILNYHAQVQNDEGLWAIYSLGQETFVSDFIYARIWYDTDRGAIVAECCDGRRVIIYDFHLLPPELAYQ